MDRSDELGYVKSELERNKILLLSSFGLEGMIKSENKERILMKIINDVKNHYDTTNNEVLNMVFNTLGVMYRADSVIKNMFDLDTITRFVAEERAYITNNLLKKAG